MLYATRTFTTHILSVRSNLLKIVMGDFSASESSSSWFRTI